MRGSISDLFHSRNTGIWSAVNSLPMELLSHPGVCLSLVPINGPDCDPSTRLMLWCELSLSPIPWAFPMPGAAWSCPLACPAPWPLWIMLQGIGVGPGHGTPVLPVPSPQGGSDPLLVVNFHLPKHKSSLKPDTNMLKTVLFLPEATF